MKIVFASHSARVGVFRVGSHHLSRELSLAGHDVAHISSPLSVAHLARLKQQDVRARFRSALCSPATDESGVAHSVPIVVAPLDRLTPSVARLQLRFPAKPWPLMTGSAARRPDFLIIDQPLLVDLIDILRPRRVVYRPTDAHFAPASRAAEVRVISRADGVVATSKPVLDEVLREFGGQLPTLVLENGVEFDRFGLPTSRKRSGVVYLGALDGRFDWAAVVAMAQAFPNEPFKIAGPLPAMVPVMPSNVQLLGGVAYASAPELLASAKVGLIPMSSDPGNEGRSPMKYYEYLASGLNVVATVSKALSARSAPGVWLYEDHVSAIQSLGHALRASSGSNADGREYARSFSWAVRAAELVEFLKGRE